MIEHKSKTTAKFDKDVDVLIVGAGVAGLSAAAAVARSNLNVVVIEKSDLIGGTARYANGSIWIPNNYLAAQKGIRHQDDDEIRFILSECWDCFDASAEFCGVDEHTYKRVEQYVTHACVVIEELKSLRILSFTQLEKIFESLFFSNRDSIDCVSKALATKINDVNEDLMRAACASWDYHWENTYNSVPYGKHIWASVDPWASGKFFGRGLRQHFWHILKNVASIRSASSLFDQLPKLFSKFWGFGHGYILTERLRRYLKRRLVPILTNHELIGVQLEDKTVVSIEVKDAGGHNAFWKINGALILASGCFSHHLPASTSAKNGVIQSSCVAASNSGDAIRILEDADVQIERDAKPLLAQTVMQVAKQNSAISHEPVFFLYGDSFFVVDRHGRRIMNEKLNYHDRAKHHLEHEREYLFLICDRRFKERNWGFGISLPFDFGFVLHSHNESELQDKLDRCLQDYQCGFRLHPEFSKNLKTTKATFNQLAQSGVDDEFGRGQNAYDVLGFLKPDHDNDSPSRTMHPLIGNDLYACILGLSVFSTHGGLLCDSKSRVLSRDSTPCENLYAVGTCAASFLNGSYPSHGLSIGTGLVFGYLAGQHAASAPNVGHSGTDFG